MSKIKEFLIDKLDLIGFIIISVIFVPLILIFEGINRITDFIADGSQDVSEWLSRQAGNLYTFWLNIVRRNDNGK